jgi:hypothetical protein
VNSAEHPAFHAVALLWFGYGLPSKRIITRTMIHRCLSAPLKGASSPNHNISVSSIAESPATGTPSLVLIIPDEVL